MRPACVKIRRKPQKGRRRVSMPGAVWVSWWHFGGEFASLCLAAGSTRAIGPPELRDVAFAARVTTGLLELY